MAAISGTVGIVYYSCSTIDVDIGVVFLCNIDIVFCCHRVIVGIELGGVCQGISEAAVVISCVGSGVVARYVKAPAIGAGKGSDGFLVIDVAGFATAIRLIYLGAVEEVDLGILCPCVFAIACTEDVGVGCSVGAVYVAYGCMDVDMGIESTAVAVVAAIDGTAAGCATLVVDIRLIDVARPEVAQRVTVGRGYAVGTAVEVVHVDG